MPHNETDKSQETICAASKRDSSTQDIASMEAVHPLKREDPDTSRNSHQDLVVFFFFLKVFIF